MRPGSPARAEARLRRAAHPLRRTPERSVHVVLAVVLHAGLVAAGVAGITVGTGNQAFLCADLLAVLLGVTVLGLVATQRAFCTVLRWQGLGLSHRVTGLVPMGALVLFAALLKLVPGLL